jgi:hypothetical protein
MKQVKFDATVLSSDGKQLKVSLSRSRGQRSLPKEELLRNIVRGLWRDTAPVQECKLPLTTIGNR